MVAEEETARFFPREGRSSLPVFGNSSVIFTSCGRCAALQVNTKNLALVCLSISCYVTCWFFFSEDVS